MGGDTQRRGEDETQREIVIKRLKADCKVRRGRPPGL
jgi:hypothetical protein